MDIREFLEQRIDTGMNRGNELEQGLGIIRGNGMMGQRGAQGCRVGRLRQHTFRIDAQALLFDTALDGAKLCFKAGAGDGGESLVQGSCHDFWLCSGEAESDPSP